MIQFDLVSYLGGGNGGQANQNTLRKPQTNFSHAVVELTLSPAGIKFTNFISTRRL